MSFVGTVVHYFGKIGVAVLELDDDLSVGDRVEFVRGDEVLFEQEITSMEIDHAQIDHARRGEDIAIKVDYKVRPGTEIYKIKKGFFRRLFGG